LEDIEYFVSYFQEFKVPIKFSIMRDRENFVSGINKGMESDFSAESNAYSPDLIKLNSFYETLNQLNEKSNYQFWSPFQKIKFNNSIKVLHEKKRVFPCYAGKADAVIYPNGDTAFCENTKAFSNLRKYDFDFYRLWHSEEANAMRKEITCCACVHGCNMVTSMLYDSNTLASIFEEAAFKRRLKRLKCN